MQRSLSRAVVLAVLLAGCGGGGDSSPTPPAPAPTVQSIAVTPVSLTMASIGETRAFVAEVRLSNGTVGSQTVTWTSSNPAVATVSTAGLVTAVGNGTAAITATAGTISGTSSVQVQQQVASVSLLPADTVIKTVFRLRGSALDARGNVVTGATVQWTSLAPTVDAVDQTGQLTPQSTGIARVRLTSGTATATVIVRTVWNVTQLSDLFPLFEQEATAGTRRAVSDVDAAHAAARATRIADVSAYLATILTNGGPADTRMYFTMWRQIWTEFIPFCGGQDFANQTAWSWCQTPISRHFFTSEGAQDTQLIGRFLTRQFVLNSNTTAAAFPWFIEGFSGYIAASTVSGTQLTGVVAPVAISDFKAGNTANNLAPLDSLMRTPNATYYVNIAQRTPVAVRNAQGVMFVAYLAKDFPAALAAVFTEMRTRGPAAYNNDAIIATILAQTGRTITQLETGYLAFARAL